MDKIVHIESVSQVHEMIGAPPPEHPLISVIESSKRRPIEPRGSILNLRFITHLYTVTLKRGGDCGVKYGRQRYDFEDGSLMFMAPGQAITPVTAPEDLQAEGEGWILLFHPDLIRGAPLAERMSGYRFFGYESREALHLSERERRRLGGLVEALVEEYSQNLDEHSHRLITSTLELLLNHCARFYGRQFITRAHAHQDVCARFEAFLTAYFEGDAIRARGLPTVQACAKEMGYSANYLSDLLRAETGRGAREHIHARMIERAKDMLLGSEQTISEIAYALGFEYPQHFSKLFKQKTGVSPGAYRH